MSNRYQRRRYGSTLPPRKRRGLPWQLLLLMLIVLLAVVYFRLPR